MPSPSSSKVEMIKLAIKQVMEEVTDGTKSTSSSSSSSDGGDDDKHHHRLLSKLMSQLEKLEAESESKIDGEIFDDKEEKIAKELKEVKRQNLITHCLLSVTIVLTVVWQISQVSIILKLKDGVSHPFRSIGKIFKYVIKPPKPIGNENHDDPCSSITSNFIESASGHDPKIPDFPHLDLPKIGFGFNCED